MFLMDSKFNERDSLLSVVPLCLKEWSEFRCAPCAFGVDTCNISMDYMDSFSFSLSLSLVHFVCDKIMWHLNFYSTHFRHSDDWNETSEIVQWKLSWHCYVRTILQWLVHATFYPILERLTHSQIYIFYEHVTTFPLKLLNYEILRCEYLFVGWIFSFIVGKCSIGLWLLHICKFKGLFSKLAFHFISSTHSPHIPIQCISPPKKTVEITMPNHFTSLNWC